MTEIIDVGNKHKCAYLACCCQIPAFEKYCSDYCTEASEIGEVEIECECGHGECELTVSRGLQHTGV
jgi:hypothetical protein